MKPKMLREGKTPVELGHCINDISIDLTESCNLRCKYCFCDTVGKNIKNDKKINSRIDIEVAKQAIDWYLKDDVSGTVDYIKSKKPLKLRLWGGEPTLYFDLMKEVVEYAQLKAKACAKPLNIGGITNLINLNDERIDWMIEHNCMMSLSVDGIGERNRLRVLPDGKNSWEIVEKKLKLMIEKLGVVKNRRVAICTVISPETVKGLSNDVKSFYNMGVRKILLEEDYTAKWDHAAYSCLFDELKRTTDFCLNVLDSTGEYLSTSIHMDSLIRCISDGYLQGFSNNGLHGRYWCTQGKVRLAISIEGAIYSCHHLNKHNTTDIEWHEKDECLGSIFEGITNIDLYKRWSDRLPPLFSKDSPLPHCNGCDLEGWCAGGCAALSKEQGGSINSKVEEWCKIKRIYYDVALYTLHRAIIEGLLSKLMGHIYSQGKRKMYKPQSQGHKILPNPVKKKYGLKYIQPDEPKEAVNGDLWYKANTKEKVCKQ